MLSNVLDRSVRVLLHDTQEGYSTDNTAWNSREVADALTTARMETYKLLVLRPEPAYITCSRMIKTAAVTSGGAAPADLFMAICGYKSDGTYVPYVRLSVGEAYRDATAMDQVIISGRTVYGTADTLIYWAKPSIAIAESPAVVDLTDFPDGFYHAVKYGAVMSLLMKEDAQSTDRWAFCLNEYKRKVSTLG